MTNTHDHNDAIWIGIKQVLFDVLIIQINNLIIEFFHNIFFDQLTWNQHI